MLRMSPPKNLESPYSPYSPTGSFKEERKLFVPNHKKDWVMDYTGHVPQMRQTYGVSGFRAVESLRNTLSPMSETISKIDYTRSSRRRIGIPRGSQLVGTGFTATLGTGDSDTFIQGTRVNMQDYYASCEAQEFKCLPIRSGFPAKNKSSVHLGDGFYFCGRHMYETTHKETFRPNEDLRESASTFGAIREEDRVHKYASAQAIVGKGRMDELELQLSEKIISRVSGGGGLLRRMYATFDKNGTGEVNPREFREVCLELGARLTDTEAMALFGRYDINGDGSMSYYEFLDAFLKEQSVGRDMKYY